MLDDADPCVNKATTRQTQREANFRWLTPGSIIIRVKKKKKDKTTTT